MYMNINFNNPFRFNLEVIEVDDYTKSFKIFLKIEIEQFQQLILYENNLWIQYETWEKFLKSLNQAVVVDCLLFDMSEIFIFNIKRINNIPILEWKFQA